MCWGRCSIIVWAALLLTAIPLMAQEPDTVANFSLDRSVVTGRLKMPLISSDKGVSGTVNVEKIKAIPSFMGNADPIRFVRLLPSIQLNTEIDGGLYLQGSEHSHTLVSQGGVPIYGAGHMLGLFSVFNASHFKGMRYSTSAGQERRLGGVIDMELIDTVSRRFAADFSLGLLSAQGTLQIPTGKHSALIITGRRTFINLVYGNLLEYDGNPIRYGFTDGNITWIWKPGPRDKIWVDLFGSRDDMSLKYSGLIDGCSAMWYNGMEAVHWNHYYPGATLKQSLYGTLTGLKSEMEAAGAIGRLPSYMQEYGYKARLDWGGWEFGAHVNYRRVQPQYREVQNFANLNDSGPDPLQTGWESVVYARYERSIGYWLTAQAGLGAEWYLSPERRSFWGLTPEASLEADLQAGGTIGLHYALRRQNLFYLGFTNTGTPSEFWVMAGRFSDPQWSHNFSLTYNLDIPAWDSSLSGEVYYRLLHNQLEYTASLMDVVLGDISLDHSLIHGRGRAYGLNLMFQKQAGHFVGWISYAYARSLRTFDGSKNMGEYPSSHERVHEVDVVGTYDFGRWDLGATFVAASGTPYTKAESFYIMGDRLICNYGPYNGSRLPPYIKLDVSANWYFLRKGRTQAGVNVSLYNVLCRENAVGYGLHIGKDLSYYHFTPTTFGLKCLPSIAFFYRF